MSEAHGGSHRGDAHRLARTARICEFRCDTGKWSDEIHRVTAPLLAVRGLTRSFYGVHALRGLDFSVAPGTITALIGPNGAGKTTAFQCISGVVPPDGGSVHFAGRDITGWRADRITTAGLTRTFQIARGIPRLTVLENLLLYAPDQPGESLPIAMAGRFRASEETARVEAVRVARRLNLLQVANNPAGALSGGQKKLLEIGRALMARPRMILLDEPIAGVNPTLAEEIADHLRALRDDGVTFLVIEHHMDLIARLCDPVIVLAEGQRLAEGGFAEIAADPAVQEAYMGRRK
jgi:branched-chain amino acid transport system ATP-binding protein/neutral amino acid transport system ATP-binding protein